LDYIRWIFKLDFCTPRYIITRELGIEKLRIGWGLRARKFEEKIGEMEEKRWVKMCWREKQKEGSVRNREGKILQQKWMGSYSDRQYV